MRLTDILLFQFGNRNAILNASRTVTTPLIGAVLVLITSIPRNYDQFYLGEMPLWPVLPLLFSFFSGTFIYLFVRRQIVRHAFAEADPPCSYWLPFLGLFWMTAPVAWLYAFPAERLFSPRTATVVNLWLLGIVSLWRVALLSRVLTVVFRAPALHVTGTVLAGAAAETCIVLFFRGFGAKVARGMGGMQHSPEELLLIQVLTVVGWGSLIVWMAAVVFVGLRSAPKVSPPEVPNQFGAPWGGLAVVAIVWAAVAIQPQRELAREHRYVTMLEKQDFKGALAYLDSLDERDWPPGAAVSAESSRIRSLVPASAFAWRSHRRRKDMGSRQAIHDLLYDLATPSVSLHRQRPRDDAPRNRTISRRR